MSNITGKFKKYGDQVIEYCITDSQKDKIVERLLEYYKEHCHFGEGIHQDDDSIIEAPSVLSDICDNIIEFKESEVKPLTFPTHDLKKMRQKPKCPACETGIPLKSIK